MTALFDFDLFILILTLYLLVWVHKTSLAPPPFIEVPVPSQDGERLCFCVLGGSILPFSTIFLLDFANVSTVWYLVFFILFHTLYTIFVIKQFSDFSWSKSQPTWNVKELSIFESW